MIPGSCKTSNALLLLLAALTLAACVAPPPRGTFARNAAAPADAPPLPKHRPAAGQVAPAPPAVPVGAVTVVGLSEGQGQASKKTLIAAQPAASLATPAVIDLPVYLVRPKDTVYGISRRLQLPIRALIDYNGLTPPYILSIGQRLWLPVQRRHSVARGETVYRISRNYGVELTELVRLNRIASPYTIKPAQKLVIPVPPLSAVAGATGAGRSLTAKSTVAKAQAVQSQSAAVPAAIPQPPPRAGSKFIWPVKGKVILGYGPKKSGLHNDGINIKAPRGSTVVAADNGVVAYVGNELRGFGNLLLIKHAGGLVTAYAHNDEMLVRRGQKVQRGQAIGRVGSTGNVSSPQLHFEVRKGTEAVDPFRFLVRQTASSGG